jgi:hypothetical protein
VCGCIVVAWHPVSPEILEKSFKVTGISNEMYGSEDLMITDMDSDSESESNDSGDDSSVGSDNA